MALQHTSLTLTEIVDEVIVRLGKLRTNLNLDYGELVKYAQHARREVARVLEPLSERSLIKTANISNLSLLPLDFIKPVRVILQEGAGEFVEARQIDPREWSSITLAGKAHSFSSASIIRPVYMINANSTATTPAWASGNMAIWVFPVSMTGQIDYVAHYDDVSFSAESDTANVPPEGENLLVAMILERVFFQHGEEDKHRSVAQEVLKEYQNLRSREQQAKAAQNIESASMPELTPSQVPPADGGQ